MNNSLEFLLFCTDYNGSILIFRHLRMLQACKPGPRHPAEHVGCKPDRSSVVFSFIQQREHIWYTSVEQRVVYVPHQLAAARDANWRGMSNAQRTRLSAFKTGRAREKCCCKWSLAWPKSQTVPKTCLEECKWPRAKPLPGTVAAEEHGQGSYVLGFPWDFPSMSTWSWDQTELPVGFGIPSFCCRADLASFLEQPETILQ